MIVPTDWNSDTLPKARELSLGALNYLTSTGINSKINAFFNTIDHPHKSTNQNRVSRNGPAHIDDITIGTTEDFA